MWKDIKLNGSNTPLQASHAGLLGRFNPAASGVTYYRSTFLHQVLDFMLASLDHLLTSGLVLRTHIISHLTALGHARTHFAFRKLLKT